MYDKIRKDGFVALVGDRSPDLAGIAAPVFGAQGALAGAVTLTMPAHRFRKGYSAAVKSAAHEITTSLGGKPWR
jgi:DNA-binding IclR family transcriptional regulator